MPVGIRIDVRSTSSSAAAEVLRLLFRFRRVQSLDDPCALRPCETCFATHRPKVEAAIERDEPIHFVILGFPAKSPNRRKVLGPLPDLGERLALGFLQTFCEYVGHFHEPGARITVCSDGHVFSDLVGVSDDEVSAYRREIVSILHDSSADRIDTFDLDDALLSGAYPDKRHALERRHAMPLDELRRHVITDPDWRTLFNGIHRFLFEDETALHPELSRNRVREETKERAYRVIQRSNAWSVVVADAFPDALRLSIHPQPCHSEKIGFHMIRTADSWLTPWHGVILDDGHALRLVKRSEAERSGASLVCRHDRPSHFVAPQFALQEVAS